MVMKLRPGLLVLSLIFAISCFPLSSQEDVTVSVKGVTTVANTDNNFICATMDWWPSAKCNYGNCPWGRAGLLNLDIKNPILFKAIKAFNSMRIRIGGSLQDQVVYKVGPKPPKCPLFKRDDSGLFGFTEGCLNMCRWDKLNDLFNKSGAVVTFGLNALSGRKRVDNSTLYLGKWDPTNSRNLMKYTASKGYKIDSWELGNELSGEGVSGKVHANQYGKDLIVLRKIVNEIYNNTESKPKLLAPGGFFDLEWFSEMLATSGQGVLDVVTHHIYNLGGGDDPKLLDKVQDPIYLSKVTQTYQDVENTISRYGPWTSAWIGESGGAFNSGGKNVSRTFADGFWYLDQLGIASLYDHKVFCRQALVGGYYSLLDPATFIPNPDYYSALLWHRLMGTKVLQTVHSGTPYLRTYAHCSKEGIEGKSPVTLLLINLSNSTAYDISMTTDLNLYPQQLSQYTGASVPVTGEREEYHLTPKDGNIQSNVMLLNGVPLTLTSSGDIPEMYPSPADASAPLHIAPHSIAFIKFKDLKVPICY